MNRRTFLGVAATAFVPVPPVRRGLFDEIRARWPGLKITRVCYRANLPIKVETLTTPQSLGTFIASKMIEGLEGT